MALEKDPTNLPDDRRTMNNEINLWISYIKNLRKAGYDAYNTFYLAYSEEPLRMRKGATLFREYGDTIAEIYDPQDGYETEKLIAEIPKNDPAMFQNALEDVGSLCVKRDGEVRNVDVDEMNDEELMDFVLSYYDRIRNEPILPYKNEFEKNYGKLEGYDFLGDWHKASEEVDEKKLYL